MLLQNIKNLYQSNELLATLDKKDERRTLRAVPIDGLVRRVALW